MNYFNKKTISFIFLSIISIFLIFLWRLQNEVKWQSIFDVSDQLNIALKGQIDKQKSEALSFAIVLSKNRDMIEALDKNDEDLAFDILNNIMKDVQKYTNKLVRTQIITADLHLFARSWDNIYAGMPLNDYRKDLLNLKNSKKPRVSIEVARRLSIIATVPVYKNNKLLGFVEVLDNFKATTSFFQNFGIDMYILMNYDFYDIAVLMQSNPTVGDYIISNRSYNSLSLDALNKVNFKILKDQHIFIEKDRYIFYIQMKNSIGRDVGMFLFVMPKKNLNNFATKEEENSFLIHFYRKNFYDVMKKEEYSNRQDLNSYNQPLIYNNNKKRVTGVIK